MQRQVLPQVQGRGGYGDIRLIPALSHRPAAQGDLAGCFANFICQYQDINFIIRYIMDDDTFELSTEDVKEVFEGMNLNDYEIIKSLTELIRENIGA